MNKCEENYIEHEVRIRLTESKYVDINTRFAEVDKRFIEVDKRFDRLEDKIDSHFKWTLGTIILLILTVVSFMVTIMITMLST